VGYDEAFGATGSALVVAENLFFGVRIEAALAKMGWTVRSAGTPEQAAEAAREGAFDLAIVEFGGRKFDACAVTVALKAESAAITVLGFMPHVRLLEAHGAAKDAGCDLLIPNSAVSTRLPEIVARLMARSVSKPDAVAAAQAVATEAE
jgi:DNA-binding NtrC family response regulator